MEDFDLFEGCLIEDTTPTEDSTSTETAEAEAEPTAEPSAGSETEPAAQTETEPPAAPQAAETIEFKRNRDVFALDKKSAESLAQTLGMDTSSFVALVQKGYDYDRRVGQLNDLESKLDGYGKSLNMDREGLFGMLQNAADRSALRVVAAQVKAEHPEWSDDAVQEISTARLAEQRRQNEANAAAQEQKQKEAETRPLVEFFMRHTDISPDSMPAEMQTDIFERGFSPEEAYQKYQNTQKDKEIENIKAQLAQMQKDAENRAKIIGSVTSEIGGKTEDDLMDEFFANFR